MIQVSHQKLSPDAILAFEEIGGDVWTGAIAEALEIVGIVQLRAVSKSFHATMSDDDMWLDRLTLLSLSNRILADLDRDAEERAYAWYARCHAAVDYGNTLARHHKESGIAYLELYGVVNGTTFTPHAELRFPIPRGFISELVALKARAGCRDPPYDALLCFPGAPAGCDMTFRRVSKEVMAATSRATLSDLRDLPDVLARSFEPAAPRDADSAQLPTSTPTRTLDTLQRRLGHMSVALARADARIEALEAENAKLRDIILQRDEEIAALKQTIYELKAELREVRGENAELRAEKAALTRLISERPTDAELEAVRAKLESERKARRAAERQIDVIKKERATLRRMLTIAERGYAEGEEAAKAADAAAEEARAAVTMVQGKAAKHAAKSLEKAAAQRARVAQAERDAAAQVAAAQLAARTWIEDALDEAVADSIALRGLMTAEEMVDYARLQSAVGAFTSPMKQIAAIVMDAECQTTVTMPTTSASGRGRGVTYMKVVKAIKPSNQLSAKQLRRRSESIREAVDHHSAGAPVAQMSDFINSQKELIKQCLETTWLSPPKALKLEDCIALKKEMSGAMYDEVIAFIREKTGAKTTPRNEVLKACAESTFEFETGSFTSVDEKEVEVGGKKIMKKVTSHGTYLRVKDPLDVARKSAQVHASSGRMAYPGNVPADMYPLTIMMDAGGGTTKVVLKHPCVKRADSVRSITLLGILIGVKDTQHAIDLAFGPIYDALSRVNEEDMFVSLPWAPRLPITGKWELKGDAQLPTCVECFFDPRLAFQSAAFDY